MFASQRSAIIPDAAVEKDRRRLNITLLCFLVKETRKFLDFILLDLIVVKIAASREQSGILCFLVRKDKNN